MKQVHGFWLVSIISMLVACQPQPTMVAALIPTPALNEDTSTTITIPARSPNYQVRWTFQTEAAIWGAPSVAKGMVYIGSDDGRLYAIKAETGDLQWSFSTQGIIRSRPSVARGLVFVSSDDGSVYAVDAREGMLAWRTDIGNFLEREAREHLGTNTAPTGWDDMQSSPVAMDDQVFVGSLDGKVYALDAATGSINWTFQTGGKVRATPTVESGIVYIGSWDGTTYALSALTGALVWSAPLGGQVQTTALVADGVVHTASRKASVVALDAVSGDLIYEYDYGRNMWVESSPEMNEGIIYIGSAGNRWVIGLDGITGEVFTGFFSKIYFMSTPAIVEDTLFIGGVTFRGEAEGGLFVFKLVDGRFADPRQPHWYFPVDKTLEADGNWSGVISSPVINDGLVYFGGLDGKLYAIELGS